MKKKTSRLPAPSTALVSRKNIRRTRQRFLRSKAYKTALDLQRAGVRHIGTVVDMMSAIDMRLIRTLAKEYRIELGKKAGSISHVINRISHALDEIALRHLRPKPNDHLTGFAAP